MWYLLSYALAHAAQSDPDLFVGNRYLSTQVAAGNVAGLSAKTTRVTLSFHVPTGNNVIHHVNQFIRKFSITHFRFRCVSLFDIVGFSKYSHFDQITLITMLSHHLYVAARQCNWLGLPVEPAMTTTGEGFMSGTPNRGLKRISRPTRCPSWL